MSEQGKTLAQQEKGAYMKAWRAAHKEKTAVYQEKYWTKRATARLAAESAGA